MSEGRGLYAYAVVRGVASISSVSGVGDGPVELVLSPDGLGLVVSDVPLRLLAGVDEGAGPAEVTGLAHRHDAVVRAAMEVAEALLPFRLGVVLRDRDAAKQFMATGTELCGAALDHVAACREWGVRVQEPGSVAGDGAKGARTAGDARGARGAGALGGSRDNGRAPAGSTGQGLPGAGAAYLARRRQELAATESGRQARARASAEVSSELRGLAVDAAPGRRRDAGIVLDENYLVHRDCEQSFLARADACGDRIGEHGLRLQVSGPWPPYSFAPAHLAAAVEGTRDG